MRYGSDLIQTFFARVPGVVVGAFVALASFILYLFTLAPTVLPRIAQDGLYDAGLFQVRAYLLSISHPTGYPTYLLLAKLFTYLPVGDIAYRVNLVSAVFGAAAVFVVFVLCRQITGRTLPSAAAATLLAVSQTFWEQAVIAEVYTLHAFFIALSISVLLLWRRTRRDRYLLLWAFLTGLAMTNHMTSGLLLLLGLLFVRLTERGKLSDRRLLLKGAGLFVLGLTPYLYLPIRALVEPPFAAYDPNTPLKFLTFVSGVRFGGHMFAFGPGELLGGRLEMYRMHLSQQFHWFFVVVAVIGLISMFHRDRPVFAMLGLLYAGWLLYALEYDITDIWVYFIPTYLVICILVAPGIVALIEGTRLVLSTLTLSSTLRAAPKVLVLLAFVALLVPVIGANGTYLAADRSGSYEGREDIEAIAENVETGATVITDGSSVWYMQLVENRRTDLNLVSPYLKDDFGSDSEGRWLRFTRKHVQKGETVYLVAPDGIRGSSLELLQEAGYRLTPREGGAFYKVSHSPKTPNPTVKQA